jgi:hypothetical protein
MAKRFSALSKEKGASTTLNSESGEGAAEGIPVLDNQNMSGRVATGRRAAFKPSW